MVGWIREGGGQGESDACPGIEEARASPWCRLIGTYGFIRSGLKTQMTATRALSISVALCASRLSRVRAVVYARLALLPPPPPHPPHACRHVPLPRSTLAFQACTAIITLPHHLYCPKHNSLSVSSSPWQTAS